MPDDLPFDETDLDMEDELEYNRGGVVEAANGTFVQNTMPITYNPLNTTQTSTATGNPTQMQPTAVTSILIQEIHKLLTKQEYNPMLLQITQQQQELVQSEHLKQKVLDILMLQQVNHVQYLI